MKKCSKTECCKQCRYVKFKGTMTKWPVQTPINRTTQNHEEHQDATYIQKKCVFFGSLKTCFLTAMCNLFIKRRLRNCNKRFKIEKVSNEFDQKL